LRSASTPEGSQPLPLGLLLIAAASGHEIRGKTGQSREGAADRSASWANPQLIAHPLDLQLQVAAVVGELGT
jgi:hypothetical protein